MNRRQFTTGLAAVASAPALPLRAALPAASTAAAVPNAARFWAIYMSHLHGSVSAKSISVMTGISQSEAQVHLTKLLADGVITPHNVFAQAAKATVQPKPSAKTEKPARWRERLNEYLTREEEPIEDDLLVEESLADQEPAEAPQEDGT